jgi:phosphopantetheinyl transferase (holo-ACP synthase)
VGIALSTSRRIGLDFEQVGGQALKLLPRFLNAEEQERFKMISELEAAQIWSFKEAAFKYFSPKKLAFVKDISIFIGEKSRSWAEIRIGNSIFELSLTAEMVEDHLISYNLDDAREKT